MAKLTDSNCAIDFEIETIWQNLPLDLVQEVLSKLPIPKLFQVQVINIDIFNMVQNIINGKSQLKQFERTRDRGLLIVGDGFIEQNWMCLTMFNFYLKRSYTMPNFISYLPKSFL